MNQREKILAAGAGIVAVLLVTYLAVNNVFLMPAARRFNQARDLMGQIERARAEKARLPTYQARLRELAGRAYGTDPLRVSERVRSRITDLLAMSGLNTERLTLKPVVGAHVPGVYREVGWLVQVRGKVSQVVDFLYLVTREPHLHRLDNLMISPVKGTDEVEVQTRYGTLVLEAAKGEPLATDTVEADLDRSALQAPARDRYDVILSRALFRPYVPAKKREPTAPAPAPESPGSPSPPEVPAGRYRVVSLSMLGEEPDILVHDSASGNVVRYKPGDALAGGTIVTVDYRPRPMPENPEIISGSRVVLRVGNEYHAVELGTYLAQRYRIEPDQVPPGLPALHAAPGKPEPADEAPDDPPAEQPTTGR